MRVLQQVKPTPEQLPILTDAGLGFRLIRGAAGSGKTTAALLRLRQLCASRLSRRQRLRSDQPVKVLVLTFNRTLRGYVKQLAQEQVGSNSGLDLTVETFAQWALSLLGSRDLINDRNEILTELLGQVGVRAKDMNYFIDEIEYVLGRFPADARELYIDALRTGRGRAPAVNKQTRTRLLTQVIEPYKRRKRADGQVDWNDIAVEVADAKSQRYDVVVVDETQDLSANQLRAVLSHLEQDHVTTFIIDAAQRIYPQGFQWRELGIELRPEMVFTLSRNHRNTKEIARFARSLLDGLPQEEDGVVPDENACQEEGQTPEVVAGRYGAQLDQMLRRVQPYLNAGETVAILHPLGGGWFSFARQALNQRDIPFCELTRQREWPSGPELVALSTIHSAKGLEFDHVLLPGINQEVTPHGGEDGDGTLQSLRRLVAMAVGRARKTVSVGYKPGEQSTVIDLLDPDTYTLVGV